MKRNSLVGLWIVVCRNKFGVECIRNVAIASKVLKAAEKRRGRKLVEKGIKCVAGQYASMNGRIWWADKKYPDPSVIFSKKGFPELIVWMETRNTSSKMITGGLLEDNFFKLSNQGKRVLERKRELRKFNKETIDRLNKIVKKVEEDKIWQSDLDV